MTNRVNVNSNPTQELKDTVAQSTDWSPLRKMGGGNFQTHRLRRVGLEKLVVEPTPFYRLFVSFFVILGVGMFCFLTWGDPVYRGERGNLTGDIFVYSISLFITFVGALFVCNLKSKVELNLTSGKYLMKVVYFRLAEKVTRNLTDVYAVQLLRGRFDPDGHCSYEVNLVFNDSSRAEVIVHGNRKKIDREAEEIAEFLDKPLWSFIPE